MTTIELLNRLKAHYGGASDYRIAQILGVTRQNVSNWKRGASTMSDKVGISVAEQLGLDAAKVLISLHIERETSNVTSPVWREIGKRLEMATVPVVVGAVGYVIGAGLPPGFA